MMRIVPLDRHLLSRLVEAERDPLTSEISSGGYFIDRAMWAASHGLAFAMIDGAEVPVGGGLMPAGPGRASAEGWWLIAGCARKRHLVRAARASLKFLNLRQRDPAYRRIEIFVRAAEAWSESFARTMGFELEGLHKSWDVLGRDYRCFARVRI